VTLYWSRNNPISARLLENPFSVPRTVQRFVNANVQPIGFSGKLTVVPAGALANVFAAL
jgi:hypothetical protein